MLTLLLLPCVFLLSCHFKSELFDHCLLPAFAMALMMVITYYSELYVSALLIRRMHLGPAHFLANSAITVAPSPAAIGLVLHCLRL